MEGLLKRQLGLWACISLVAGSVIGSGIFMKPATMAAQLGSPLLLLGVWIFGGIISIFGGMINSEIGAMLPVTGGQYSWFRIMYGRFFAFMFGWASYIVINTAAIAAIAFIFAQYTTYFITLPHFDPETETSIALTIPMVGKLYPLQNIGIKALAIMLIVAVTAINHRSVKAGGRVQVLFTFLKVAALLFLIAGIFFFGNGDVNNLVRNSVDMETSSLLVTMGAVAAMSGALSAYDGWNNLGFAAGEIRDPQKNIPRSLIWGLIICMALYVLTTEAYLYMMPIDEMKNSKLVATDALSRVMGAGGVSVVAALIMISTAGAVNGNVLPCSRVTFAMAEDKLFLKAAGRTHKRFHTPHVSLWLQAAWSCLFVISGSFDMLMDLFVFVTWIFYGFAGYGIFILRKKMPDAVRPYRMKGYPWIPVVFIAFSVFYFFLTLYNDINNYREEKTEVVYSALGLMLLVAGLPFYWWWNRRRKINTDRG